MSITDVTDRMRDEPLEHTPPEKIAIALHDWEIIRLLRKATEDLADSTINMLAPSERPGETARERRLHDAEWRMKRVTEIFDAWALVERERVHEEKAKPNGR